MHDLRVLTSLPAGKMVPLAVVPVLREDAVQRGTMRISFEMQETVEVLLNAINVRTMAYFVPFLAFDRFLGMDDLNRSYMRVAAREGQPVTPFFETMAAPAHSANEIFTYMGKHFRPGATINTAYIEAYNAIWNFRAKNRSPDITQRGRLDGDLAPAFWLHDGFRHIVPDFDQAMIDGQVALNVVNSKMPVKGLGIGKNQLQPPGTNVGPIIESGSTVDQTYATGWRTSGATAPAAGQAALYVKQLPGGGLDVFAELQDNGITISLSNLEMARKTQAFARLRQQYNGLDDEYIIDMLMNGLSVPDEGWKQPILLSDQRTVFGMSKRYASDAANLTESVVNGATSIDMTFRMPQCPTGGVIMIVAEITPEQLFERQKDVFLHTTDTEDLPELLRDTLDPEKVVAVKNEYVDIDHDTPNGTFGYAPLNFEWTQTAPQIGGRFYRPAVDAGFDEDRQRIWAVETQNPVLSSDFYLCTTMHTKPFKVTNQDPFEGMVRGAVILTGNTVFGGALVENTNDYAEVLAEAPQERLAK